MPDSINNYDFSPEPGDNKFVQKFEEYQRFMINIIDLVNDLDNSANVFVIRNEIQNKFDDSCAMCITVISEAHETFDSAKVDKLKEKNREDARLHFIVTAFYMVAGIKDLCSDFLNPELFEQNLIPIASKLAPGLIDRVKFVE